MNVINYEIANCTCYRLSGRARARCSRRDAAAQPPFVCIRVCVEGGDVYIYVCTRRVSTGRFSTRGEGRGEKEVKEDGEIK